MGDRRGLVDEGARHIAGLVAAAHQAPTSGDEEAIAPTTVRTAGR